MMKTGLTLTRDEIDRKKGRSWKEGRMEESKCRGSDGLMMAHSRFIVNVIVFFLLVNFLKIFLGLSLTLLQH